MASIDAVDDRPEVFAVPESSVRALFERETFVSEPRCLANLLAELAARGGFVNREWAEHNPSVKQIVSFAVLHHDDEILCLRRAKLERRANLRLRHTILFGGHVDDADRGSPDPLRSCVRRELSEELGLTSVGALRLLGIVADPTSLAGQLHLGVVFECSLSSNIVQLPHDIDREHVRPTERNLYRMMPIVKLSALIPSMNPWSRIVAYSGVLQGRVRHADRLALPSRQLHLFY